MLDEGDHDVLEGVHDGLGVVHDGLDEVHDGLGEVHDELGVVHDVQDVVQVGIEYVGLGVFHDLAGYGVVDNEVLMMEHDAMVHEFHDDPDEDHDVYVGVLNDEVYDVDDADMVHDADHDDF